MAERIYLDHASTTPILPEAVAAMNEACRFWANPSSPHAEGRAAQSRCDALQTKLVSSLTFEVLRDRGVQGVSVSDSEAEEAMMFAMRHLRLVVEPGGAVALAAALTGAAGGLSERSVVVVSGGNVDPLLYADMLSRAGG